MAYSIAVAPLSFAHEAAQSRSRSIGMSGKSAGGIG